MAIPFAAILIFGFQNCGPSFQTLDQNSTSEVLADLSIGSELPVEIKETSGGNLISDTDNIVVNVEYTARIAGTRIPSSATVTWTATAATGASVHTHPGESPSTIQLHCEAAGAIYLSVKVVDSGITYISSDMTLSCVAAPTTAPTPAPTGPGTMVTFRIPTGTGNGAWNTLTAPVNVKIGQTLRIYNDDLIVHRLHTGGAPCGHQPSNSNPGSFYDCVVTKAIAPNNGGTYDHNIGTAARLYINATP